MSSRTKPDNPLAFNAQLKGLIDKHLGGDKERAARALGVSTTTIHHWVKGTHIPGFEKQTMALRKLRSL